MCCISDFKNIFICSVKKFMNSSAAKYFFIFLNQKLKTKVYMHDMVVCSLFLGQHFVIMDHCIKKRQSSSNTRMHNNTIIDVFPVIQSTGPALWGLVLQCCNVFMWLLSTPQTGKQTGQTWGAGRSRHLWAAESGVCGQQQQVSMPHRESHQRYHTTYTKTETLH